MTLTVQDVRRIPASAEIYEPQGAAAQLWSAHDPEVLIEGPWGTGKTRACLEKIHLAARKYDGARFLIVRKTRKSLTDSVLVTFEEKVLTHRERLALQIYRPQRAYRREYQYGNGTRIVLGGMDNPHRVLSTEYDVIYVPEATELSEHEWELLGGRCRNGVMPYQQLMADCNPDRPAHWLNTRCNRGLTRRLKSKHKDNPAVTDAYLERLRALTGVRRARYYEGRWVGAEGAIYAPPYRSDVHLVDPFDVPVGWPRYWVVDFGFNNPFVWQEWAESPDGDLYRIQEIYHTRRRVAEHCADIRRLTEGGPRPKVVVCDHDAESRATLERELGVQTKAAYKAVKPGIEAVQARLSYESVDDEGTPADGPAGRPRLFFVRDALFERDRLLDEPMSGPPLPACSEEEIESYTWDEARDAPVKQDDHGMDAMRYVVAEVDQIWRSVSRDAVRSLPADHAKRNRTLVGGTDWQM